MGETNSQPPMAWRYCGNQLKLWRTQAGISREALAEEAHYEYESVKSMEQGRRRPSMRLLEVADEMCGAHGMLTAAQDYLKPEKFPARTQEYMEFEHDAIALHWYETLLVPGLLQTEEYARALMEGWCPPLDDETVTERLAARMQRQERMLTQPTVLYGFVIHEAALRELVGSAEIMKQQLHRLLELGQLRNVSVQVLPFGRGVHPGLTGPHVLLETPEHEHYAYVEGQETGALYADPTKVGTITQRHGMIRMQAHNVEESARFIGKVAEEL